MSKYCIIFVYIRLACMFFSIGFENIILFVEKDKNNGQKGNEPAISLFFVYTRYMCTSTIHSQFNT